MERFVIKTDGDIDAKDVKRALHTYMRENDIGFDYCHAQELL